MRDPEKRATATTRVSARVLARYTAALLLYLNEETDAGATAEEETELSKQGENAGTTICKN